VIDFFEHIDDYMEGSLDPSLQLQFEAALKTDKSLAKAVENYDVAKKISEALLEIEIAQTIADLENESNKDATDTNEDTRKTPIKNNSKLLWLLLGICLLSFLAYLGFKKGQEEKSLNQFMATVFKAPIDPDATKSIDEVKMDDFQRAKYYYRLNRFKDSEALLKEIIQDNSNQDTIQLAYFWLGHALIQQQQLDAARSAWLKSGMEEVENCK